MSSQVVIGVVCVNRDKKFEEQIPRVGGNSALFLFLQEFGPQTNACILILEQNSPVTKQLNSFGL